jgi:small subunit ribosomal protein S17
MATVRLINSSGARLLQSSTLFGSRVLGPTAFHADAAASTIRPLVTFPFSRSFSSNDTSPIETFDDLPNMSNEDLADTSTIPGWNLIHSPPRKFPRGALVGTVVSDKMTKTVNVAVDRYRIVPKIRKRVRYTRKFMAHDELEVANTGDLVMITPCHRLSKHKHFMLREIIRPKGQL